MFTLVRDSISVSKAGYGVIIYFTPHFTVIFLSDEYQGEELQLYS